MFDTVLVANRGEIAVRVVRACRELGLRSVAVYAEDDRESTAVRLADRAVRIGPASPRTYRDMAAIVEAARLAGAGAVHPGYGFLSEDPDFAEVCASAGLAFVGPPAPVLATLGDKAAARAVMADVGLPLLPGSLDPLPDLPAARRHAAEVGYPVMLKAVAGGGGRGLRVVGAAADLPAAYVETRAAAQAVFGDGRVFLERYLTGARHVEVQVLRDSRGGTVALGERDCSVQRRYQKLVEETPAPGLPAELTARLRDAAVRGAEAAGLVGAGTFEFLVDADGGFFFMEANPRLQVEHPVTELVTGVDIVAAQLRIAAGDPLDPAWRDRTPTGAAVECRINAEDPERNFRPAPGVLDRFMPPGGPFVRVDTHAYPGWRISPLYDSLIAKVIAWGPGRAAALARMRRALDECDIAGPTVRTTAGFLRRLLDDPRFVVARHDTGMIDRG